MQAKTVIWTSFLPAATMPGMNAYPLTFEPIFKSRIWGGQRLKQVFDKKLPADEKIGESWELADLPQDKSTIANGAWTGRSLGEIVALHALDITGSVDSVGPFPLLIKLLDAQTALSVQVHPDAKTCRRTGKGDPKTECWYIMQADPGAFIYKGLKSGTTRAAFTQAIGTGSVENLLQKVPVRVGECHFLPSGTTHAIGSGLLIAEIQQPSDTTYRVFDFNRLGTDGKPRELHVTDALESIHFDQDPGVLPVTTVGRLVDSEVFTVDKGHQIQGSQVLLSAGVMRILILLDGEVLLTGTFADVTVYGGMCVLIPATCETVMHFTEETEYLTVTL
ncbi:type I phosphomannose isomerase catalytic subunit [Planctomycetota bacterium]